MGEVADRVRNLVPTAFRACCLEHARAEYVDTKGNPPAGARFGWVCGCKSARTFTVKDALTFTSPADYGHHICVAIEVDRIMWQRRAWWLSQGVCSECRTLYWRTDPADDPPQPKPTPTALPTFLGMPIMYVEDLSAALPSSYLPMLDPDDFKEMEIPVPAKYPALHPDDIVEFGDPFGLLDPKSPLVFGKPLDPLKVKESLAALFAKAPMPKLVGGVWVDKDGKPLPPPIN